MGRGTARATDAARDAQDPAARAAEIALGLTWAWLALWLLARAALTFVPGMALWGLNLQRFLPPAPAWTGWALCVASLIPVLARRAAPGLRAAGDFAARHPALLAALMAAGLASAAWLQPDAAHFTGDFLMRLGALTAGVDLARVFPQAMPLDLFLHHRLPVWLMGALGVAPQVAERIVALPAVALLGVLGVAFARTLALRGAAGAAAVAAVTFGGWLGLFTGLGKPFGELSLLALATAVLGARIAREGRGHLTLGIVLALGLWLHRAALGFLPAALAAWIVWLRGSGRRMTPGVVAGAIVPLAALAAATPRLLQAIAGNDARNFLPQGASGAAGAIFAPLHLLDALDVVLLLAPLTVLLPALAVVLRPVAARRPEAAVMAALTVPFAALLIVVQPPQGAFRDWDLYTPGVMALAAVTAWLLALAIERAPARAWLALPVAMAAIVPALLWLAHLHRLEPALERIERYLVEPPERARDVTAVTWSYLGIRYSAMNRLDASAEAWAQAAALAPSPRFLVNRAVAEEARGRLQTARDVFREAIDRAPDTYEAWIGYARASFGLGRLDDATRAAERAAAMRPSDPEPRAVLEAVRRRAAEPLP